MFPFPACPITTLKNSAERVQSPCLWAEVPQRNRDWWKYTNTHEEPFQRGTRSFLGPSGDLPVFSQMVGYSVFLVLAENKEEFLLSPSSGRGIHLGRWVSLLSSGSTYSLLEGNRWLVGATTLSWRASCGLAPALTPLQGVWPGIAPLSFHLHLESFCLLLAPHFQSWGDPFCQKLDFKHFFKPLSSL